MYGAKRVRPMRNPDRMLASASASASRPEVSQQRIVVIASRRRGYSIAAGGAGRDRRFWKGLGAARFANSCPFRLFSV